MQAADDVLLDCTSYTEWNQGTRYRLHLNRFLAQYNIFGQPCPVSHAIVLVSLKIVFQGTIQYVYFFHADLICVEAFNSQIQTTMIQIFKDSKEMYCHFVRLYIISFTATHKYIYSHTNHIQQQQTPQLHYSYRTKACILSLVKRVTMLKRPCYFVS